MVSAFADSDDREEWRAAKGDASLDWQFRPTPSSLRVLGKPAALLGLAESLGETPDVLTADG
jgi:hypothetical protein